MQFAIEFQAEHLERTLAAVRRAIAEPAELLGEIGESLLRVNRERHDRGVAPDGSKWKELAPLTLAAGDRKGGPLEKTRRMLQTFHHQVAGNTLRMGFFTGDGFKADFHNAGTRPYVITPKKANALAFAGMYRKRVNHPGLPARPVVGFPESDRQLTIDVTADHLTAVINHVR